MEAVSKDTKELPRNMNSSTAQITLPFDVNSCAIKTETTNVVSDERGYNVEPSNATPLEQALYLITASHNATLSIE